MARFNEYQIHTLTTRDVERINGLLRSVTEAVGEIINYRCVRPMDPEADFPCEDFVYEQTSSILQEVDSLDQPF